MSTRYACRLTSCRQKLWSVEIEALPKRRSCPLARGFPASAAWERARCRRSRISLAAASVKVTTSRRSTSTGSSGSNRRRRIRSTSTDVLPEPAAAETSTSLPRTAMARSWLGVQRAARSVVLALAVGSTGGRFMPFLHPPRDHLPRSEEHTSELQSRENLVCRLLLEKKKL